MFHRYAQPKRFMTLAQQVRPWVLGLGLVLLAVGLYGGLLVAPPDALQGEVFRIMYVHVPSSWLAMAAYGGMALGSLCGLVWRHPLGFFIARAIAPVGMVFALCSLMTGAIWGYPTWGTFWVWDARLTSTLVLMFLFVAYMGLTASWRDPWTADKAGGILALVGVINLPIIKFSVEWWNTLHQPASVRLTAPPTIAPEMLWPLLVMLAASSCLFLWLVLVRTEAVYLRRKRWQESLLQLRAAT